MKIILASQSPRRASILDQIGFDYEIFPSTVDEDKNVPDIPVDHVIELSHRKAINVKKRYTHSYDIIIAADTIVVYNNTILGKPIDSSHAYKMLSRLNNTSHEVFTGITILNSKGKSVSNYEVTKVYFRNLSDTEIEKYIKTKEPLDKAGAYGIQGKGAILVEKIEGCYYNVVGLPIAKLLEMLKKIY